MTAKIEAIVAFSIENENIQEICQIIIIDSKKNLDMEMNTRQGQAQGR